MKTEFAQTLSEEGPEKKTEVNAVKDRQKKERTKEDEHNLDDTLKAERDDLAKKQAKKKEDFQDKTRRRELGLPPVKKTS